jgi:hypothetical protein
MKDFYKGEMIFTALQQDSGGEDKFAIRKGLKFD